ncbi:MAG: CAP domain-containing protein [Thermodesulfovibrio sp.]|nr:CAP domain-containing protein [Thermodesulfovibrio sp.]
MPEKVLLKIIAVILSVLCTVVILESSERDARSHRLSGPHADATHLEKKIHTMINKERAKKGLPALVWDDSLQSIARTYSQDMVQRNFFSHVDPDGRTFYDRYKAVRFECRIQVRDTTCLGAENIAQDNLYSSSFYKDGKTFYNSNTEYEIAESVVKRWMSSKSHRKNILTPYFKRQGIGVALAEDGKVYVTENFC